ncbi:MAG: low molecular weight phosphotyrosine protein phosphatase [Nocardioides sp.]|uniref:low molecular weight protein-tyrosine-phosphatase n=1 Tax=Nocardioides sp. TaxID=35761 RepID=UPI0026226B34|nr:low molecular weight protein-tyrosine-phosphatase [Nocardioides sp.]MCW2834816.1 low molecular weight phosphotyrosine protein phosphatase [Nocardioides sp.]
MLPPPQVAGRYRVSFICAGNICRSPSADVVLAHQLAEAGLAGRVEVASGGMGDWHVGNPMDERSASALSRRGYDSSRHRAQQVQVGWFERDDVLFAMDQSHRGDLLRLGGGDRVRLFGDFDPETPGVEVPDPYYGGTDGFEEVLDMIERTCRALVPRIERVLSPS